MQSFGSKILCAPIQTAVQLRNIDVNCFLPCGFLKKQLSLWRPSGSRVVHHSLAELSQETWQQDSECMRLTFSHAPLPSLSTPLMLPFELMSLRKDGQVGRNGSDALLGASSMKPRWRWMWELCSGQRSQNRVSSTFGTSRPPLHSLAEPIGSCVQSVASGSPW